MMRKLLLMMVLFAGLVSAKQANASSYMLNEQAIDQLFDQAIETSMILADYQAAGALASNAGTVVSASNQKDPVVAILLDFFLGGLGVHRFYLGTKPLTGIGYILTCGGIFGIVPLIDFIVLIIDHDDISPYIDNPKFFMW